jgi:hypothetical protein
MRRLEEEVRQFARAEAGFSIERPQRNWFISQIFFDAFPRSGESNIDVEDARSIIASRPCSALFDFLTTARDEERLRAVTNYSRGAASLRQKLETNRQTLLNEPLSMRRRLYGALLLANDLERILSYAQRGGVPWQSLSDIGPKAARRLVDAVPTLNVERELVLRREGESHPLSENDFRDVMALLGAIPYSDFIVAEKNFVNLSIQSGLGKKYETLLTTNLGDIDAWLDAQASEF